MPSLKGFTQFGEHIDNANLIPLLMSFHRLCVTVPYAGNRMFEEGDEKIFKLNRNKGKYSQSQKPVSD